MATPRVTIDQLPEQAAAEDTNFVIVQDEGITKKMSMATLKNVTSNPLAAHLADTIDAHDASAISAVPAGAGVVGTDVQTQLVELATLVDALPTLAESDAKYVELAGDTMAGPLVLPGAPTLDLHASTKKYVDDSIIASTGGITEAEADARYVNITGDTMTGALSVEGGLAVGSLPITSVGSGVAASDAATIGQAVLKSGSTMTGALTLPASDPTNANHAARKAYVDRRVAFRWQRTADNVPIGDTAPGGTYTNQENVGGWTGVGSVANPLVVPETATYALMGLVNGGSFSGNSAIVFDIGGVYFIIPFQPGTTAYTGGSLVMRCAVGGQIVWRIRNNSGATVNNVSFTAEATKLA